MTVIELVVAIALLGILVTIATSVLGAVTAGGQALQRATGENATAGVSMSALRSLLASAGPDEGRPVFTGGSRRARLMSYCADAMGDIVRCEVTIEATLESGGPGIERWSAGGPLLRLRGATLAYLPDQLPRRWISDWEATERIPSAVAVIAGNDTTFLRVGRP